MMTYDALATKAWDAEARVRELEDALREIEEVAEEESLDDALGADQPYVNESWTAVHSIARSALAASPSREETP